MSTASAPPNEERRQWRTHGPAARSGRVGGGKLLPQKCWGCEGDASACRRYRDHNWSPALPARHVVNDLLTLPLAQRLELVQRLWDSIAAEQIGPELTETDRQLIDQRLENFLADGDPGLDADAVLDSLEQTL
jgi:putative addiction module component (TIGR02574 family)